jgi:hypothetical protein
MVKFGSPELFFKDHEVRFGQLITANNRFQQISAAKRDQVKDKVDDHTSLFIKGYGTDPELISCFRELLFNSRELLDSLLFYIQKETEGKTNKKFLPFAKSLMSGSYDDIQYEILPFLKLNFTYVFHLRKFRNEIKNRVSNIEFLLITKQVTARFQVPIPSDEKALIEFLEINNKDQAMKKGSYYCQINLSEYFPGVIDFWRTVFSIMK